MTDESPMFLPASARGYFARRPAARLQRRRDQMMSRAFCEGADARLAGLRCKPPAAYHVEIGLDLPGEWIAGWATVDRQLFREAGAQAPGALEERGGATDRQAAAGLGRRFRAAG